MTSFNLETKAGFLKAALALVAGAAADAAVDAAGAGAAAVVAAVAAAVAVPGRDFQQCQYSNKIHGKNCIQNH